MINLEKAPPSGPVIKSRLAQTHTGKMQTIFRNVCVANAVPRLNLLLFESWSHAPPQRRPAVHQRNLLWVAHEHAMNVETERIVYGHLRRGTSNRVVGDHF